ncbi:MAG: phosphoribosylglycinamide formyltransferase, partial [Acidimicrobiia bacterium]
DPRKRGVDGRYDVAYVVLVSGAGSNLEALIEADVGKISSVVADGECPALAKAEAVGISTRVIPYRGGRASFTREILDVAGDAEALVLAGFMRILGKEAIARFPNRIVNIHPSLLPSFPGLDAVAQALAAGVKVTGATVHFVDELLDHGPIIAQKAVPVLPGDNACSLHKRIQIEEHVFYPRVVEALLAGRLSVEGRTVSWS